MGLHVLQTQWSDYTEADRTELLRNMEAHVRKVYDSLLQMVQGLPEADVTRR